MFAVARLRCLATVCYVLLRWQFMIPPLDIAEAFIRAWLSANSRRWRRACLAALRASRRCDQAALWVAEQQEQQIAEHEQKQSQIVTLGCY